MDKSCAKIKKQTKKKSNVSFVQGIKEQHVAPVPEAADPWRLKEVSLWLRSCLFVVIGFRDWLFRPYSISGNFLLTDCCQRRASFFFFSLKETVQKCNVSYTIIFVLLRGGENRMRQQCINRTGLERKRTKVRSEQMAFLWTSSIRLINKNTDFPSQNYGAKHV